MRKIIVFENITLDGFFSGPNGEYDWAIQDPEFNPQVEGQGEVDLFMFGRITYDIMAAFWPSPAAEAASPRFARALNNTPKIVFSRSLEEAGWQGTQILSEIRRSEVENLKQMQGGDIMIFGSGSIVKQLAQLGLIDEYQLILNPLVLGKGKSLFEDLDKVKLKLMETRSYKSGIVFLRYQPQL